MQVSFSSFFQHICVDEQNQSNHWWPREHNGQCTAVLGVLPDMHYIYCIILFIFILLLLFIEIFIMKSYSQ